MAYMQTSRQRDSYLRKVLVEEMLVERLIVY